MPQHGDAEPDIATLPSDHHSMAMDKVQQDTSGIQHLLKAWHKMKNIKCPTCKASLFHIDGTPFSRLPELYMKSS